MKKFLIGVLVFSSFSSFAETCAEELSWYEDCSVSLFWGSNSKRCEKQLIRDYAAGLFYPMNRHLRDISEDVTCEKVSEKLKRAVTRLKVSKVTTLYRGMRHFPTLDKLKPGDCFSDKGYLSTSLIEKKAKNFTDDDKLFVFEITNRSGREVLNYVGYKHEQEILFLPNTVFKVSAVEDRINTSEWNYITKERRFFLEEIDKGECSVIHN